MAEPYLGQVIMGGWNFAPRGYISCNGQLLSIAQNSALFALLGTTFGGDGITTFALPNLQGRHSMHWGQGPGLSNFAIGQVGGSETVTLTTAQLPTHTHTAAFADAGSVVNATTTKGTSQIAATGSVLGRTVDSTGKTLPFLYAPSGSAATVPLAGLNVAGTVSVSVAGNNQPIPIRSPYLGITHCIAVEGIFPSRN